jgi:hypothetical protein
MIHKFLHIWQKIVEFDIVIIRIRLVFRLSNNVKNRRRAKSLSLYFLPFTFYLLLFAPCLL